ncbi:MAG: NUDIX domain-containing protein [Parcubacteria group bacterium]|nr:NUDIX domain-containing protein [Parcubacteria group bacterium]
MSVRDIIFDADGMVIDSEMFSVQYGKEFGISPDEMLPFFNGVFTDCKVGKADIKKELRPFLSGWKWTGTVDEFLQYWFKAEHHIDERMVGKIKKLRSQGIKCYLVTDNEKYRTKYLREEMGLGELFDGIFSSPDIGYEKSDRRCFEKVYRVLQKNGTAKNEIMFWDNDQENVEVARKFGLVGHLYQNFAEFEKIVYLTVNGVKRIIRTAVCFIEYDGKFLILHRHPEKPEGDTWGLVGGKVDRGESDKVAVVREIEEEVGLKVAPDKLEFLGTFTWDYNDIFLILPTYRVALDKSVEISYSPTEHQDYLWVTPTECYARQDLIRGFHELLEKLNFVNKK